jgi:hypothetical protein
MDKNLRNAIIITVLGVLTFLVTMGVFAYFFHKSLWGSSSLQDIFYIFLASCFTPTSLGLLIVGSIGLYKHLNVKKVTFSFIMIAIYLSPIAILGTYNYIDRQIYNATYTFTVEKWAVANQEERARIIPFFRQQYDLVGDNIDVVIPLLGTPDKVTDTTYFYNLGLAESVLVTEPIYYLVNFNEQYIVTSERVFQGYL